MVFHQIERQWGKNLINIKKMLRLFFSGSGVLFELSKYFKEEAGKKIYSVYDLMYNIPCIHRAFSLTYSCPELFIPIRDIKFIVDSELKKGWVQFQVDERYANGNSLRYVPKQYEKVKYQDSTKYLMRKKAAIRMGYSWR